jgi:hypothetical protein
MKNILFIIFFIVTSTCYSQEVKDPKLSDFTHEIHSSLDINGSTISFLWLTSEYWRVIVHQDKTIPAESIKYIEDMFKDYLFLITCDVKIQDDMTVSSVSEEDMRKLVSIIDENGKKHYPLNKIEISDDVVRVSEAMIPMFSKLLGNYGEGFHIFLFEVKDKHGDNLINPSKKGEFKIVYNKIEINYKLPLDCFLPSKTCSKDGAEMKGSWKYCPEHGVKLKK